MKPGIDHKMDEVSSTASVRKAIGEKTGQAFLTCVSIYLIVSMNGWDPIAQINQWIMQFVPEGIGQMVVQIIASFMSAGLLYKVLEKLVTNKICYEWKNQNKDIWVKGLWLHIHDKKNIRVGVVKIEQDFYSIKVKGYNVSPKMYAMDESRWSHLLGRIVSIGDGHKIYGYYENKHGISGIKGGMHVFDILETSNGSFPMQMSGEFRDLINSEKQDITNAVGEISLFRLTESSPYYDKIIDTTTGLIDYGMLVQEISRYMKYLETKEGMSKEEFAHYDADPFMRKLYNVIKKHENK